MTGITIGTAVLYSILLIESQLKKKNRKIKNRVSETTKKEVWTLFDKMKYMFGKDKTFTIVWLGITGFDLFVANWMTQDFYDNYKQTKQSTMFHYACLFVTMLFGPCGFLMYNVGRNTLLIPK